MDNAREDGEKATRIGPKSTLSIALVASLLVGAGYLGKVESRIESLESSRDEVRSDVKQLLSKVDDIRVHIAAMDDRRRVDDERLAGRTTRGNP